MKNKNNLTKQEKASINYFMKTDTLKFVGGGLLIAGLICLWIGWGYIGYILAFIGTPAGLILFFIGASGKVSDVDMDKDIESKMAGLYIDIDNDKHYQLKLLKNLKEVTIEGYKYHDNVMIKKTKLGSLRTSEFTRSKIKILKDSLYIVSREISLICDDVSNNTYEISYDSIKTIEIERESKRMIFNNNTFIAKPTFLHIVYDEYELRLPIVDAVTSDSLVDTIKHQIKMYNEQKTEK